MVRILLALYLLFLSGIPCVDAQTPHAQKETTAQHSGEEHQDLCPPFCTCNCCGMLALFDAPFQSYAVWNSPAVIVQKIPEYTAVFVSTFFKSIWQPPKISV